MSQHDKPVAWIQTENFVDENNLWDERKKVNFDGYGMPLYSRPAQWKGLKPGEMKTFYNAFARWQEESPEASGWFEFARAIEALLRERNT